MRDKVATLRTRRPGFTAAERASVGLTSSLPDWPPVPGDLIDVVPLPPRSSEQAAVALEDAVRRGPGWPAGVGRGVYETDEDMVADEIGLIHPRWRGTPVWVGWGALYFYRKVEVAGERHRYPYVGPFGARPRRLYDGMEDLTGWDVLVVQKELDYV